jgi:GNAT superfamily N-acetyltransferase
MSVSSSGVVVRPLQERELAEGDRIMRLAFGTFLGLADPMAFMGDADYVRTRWAADPTCALAAEVDGRLVGTNFVTRWGSLGFFGPLTVDPSFWDKGVARAILTETLPFFDRWAVTHAGLFTLPQSPKHLSLYQSYGFMPRFLTPVLAKPLASQPTGDDSSGRGTGDGAAPWGSAGEAADIDTVVAGCARVTDATYPGLDVTREIQAVAAQKLGDTLVVHDDAGGVSAFAATPAPAPKPAPAPASSNSAPPSPALAPPTASPGSSPPAKPSPPNRAPRRSSPGSTAAAAAPTRPCSTGATRPNSSA